MKALVIGGTGFVGMNVTRALTAAGHDVVATRRVRANTLFARKLGARLVPADLSDLAGLTEAMRGREVVFMCAGHYPRYSLDLDREVELARQGVSNALEAATAAGVSRFVLTSSVATVGPAREGRTLSNETDPMDPRSLKSVYFAVKRAVEMAARRASAQGLDVVTLCPAGILGELDVKAGTGFVIVALANGLLPFYIDGRTNIVDADQMGAAHVIAAESAPRGARYILGGHNVTIRALMETACEELNVRCDSWRLPLTVAGILSTLSEMRCASQTNGARPFIPREFVDMVRFGQWVDSSLAERDLGLDPPIPLHTTVRKACAWYERFRYFRRSPSPDPTWRQVGRRVRAGSSEETNRRQLGSV